MTKLSCACHAGVSGAFYNARMKITYKQIKPQAKPLKKSLQVSRGVSVSTTSAHDVETVELSEGVSVLLAPIIFLGAGQLYDRVSEEKQEMIRTSAKLGVLAGGSTGSALNSVSFSGLSTALYTSVGMAVGIFCVALILTVYKKITHTTTLAYVASEDFRDRFKIGMQLGYLLGYSVGVSMLGIHRALALLVSACLAVFFGLVLGALCACAPAFARFLKKKTEITPFNTMSVRAKLSIASAFAGVMSQCVISFFCMDLSAIIGAVLAAIFVGVLGAILYHRIKKNNETENYYFATLFPVMQFGVKTGVIFGSMLGLIIGSVLFPGLGALAGAALGAVAGLLMGGLIAFMYHRSHTRKMPPVIAAPAADSEKTPDFLKKAKLAVSLGSILGSLIGGILGTFACPLLGTVAGCVVGAAIGTAIALLVTAVLHQRNKPKMPREIESKKTEKTGIFSQFFSTPKSVAMPECESPTTQPRKAWLF